MAFFDIFNAGGLVMFPLVLISLAAVAFAVERFLAYNQFGGIAPGLTASVLDLVKKGRPGDALKQAEAGNGPVAACLAIILRNRNAPTADIEREVSSTGEDYFLRLERFLPALDTFTTLSPLLGLLGTILGMVKVFQQFTAASNDEAAKARILAGVGESLYATAFGIAIAVFCFAVYNYYSARQRAVSIETQQASTKLIALLHEQSPDAATMAPASQAVETDVPLPRRRRGGEGRQLKKTKVEIIPMIDTMFFLLVFFILSSVGIIKLNGLPVTLPTAENGAAQKPAELTVSINAEKQIKVNNVDVKPGQDIGPVLQKEIRKQLGRNQKAIDNASVVISADTVVPNGLVVKLIDQARGIGISKFAIATDKKNEDAGSVDAGDTGFAP